METSYSCQQRLVEQMVQKRVQRKGGYGSRGCVATRNTEKKPLFQLHSLSLSQFIFEAISPHSVSSFSLSLSLIHWYCCSSVRHVCFLGLGDCTCVCVSLGHAGVCYMGSMLLGTSRLCIQEGNASAVTRSHYVLPRRAPQQRPLLLERKR